MNIENIDIASLVPDPNNVRKHSQKNLDAIKGSLTKFGQQKPIVVDEKNVVIAGNGTFAAAKELGWKSLNCVVTSLSGFEKTAFALADNRTAELAKWDQGGLDEMLASLQLNDFDVTEIGFDMPDLDSDLVKEEVVKPGEELNIEDFKEFKNTCPKCGFEYNDK